MPTKLGFQLHDANTSPDALNRLAQMRPVALLVRNKTSLLDQAYNAIGAGPVYIYQRYGMGDAQTFLQKYTTVRAAVDAFIEEIDQDIAALRWAYHCTFSTPVITEQIAEFEALAMEQVADRFGARLCIGNVISGNPMPEDWAVYRPALDAASRYNGIVGLRELYPILPYVGYGPNANIPDTTLATIRKLRNEIAYPQGITAPAQFAGRYRYLRDYCRKNKVPLRIIITESGAGRVLPQWMDAFGANLGFWQTLKTVWQQFGFSDAQTHYAQDFIWLDQHVYRSDPEVIGTCIYAWNTPDAPTAEIGTATSFLNTLQSYLENARRDQPLGYQVIEISPPAQYTVIVSRLRIRAIPSMNTKYVGGFDRGESFTATHYTLNDGMLWVKHAKGWSVYAPLLSGEPDYADKYLEGPFISIPRQDASVNNFVGTITEVRQFLQAHQGKLFYIEIDPDQPPDGARQFRVTVFDPKQGRRIIDELHPTLGDPLMTPGAKQILRDAGQL
jgi:hypothetical protein